MPPLQTVREWQDPDLVQRPPLASVVVSLYNYADRITEALQSVRVQTQQRLELIVVDDASTDEGTAVVERLTTACALVTTLSYGCCCCAMAGTLVWR